ncbi:MAG TPA: CAP domain-containing protein [Streptosporangiaceae bacterium]|nr:CAP domain-containing protein [Streptosporangiaceae bacterium]
MSRSVTRATLIISIPLLTLAVLAIVGSQRSHSVAASRPQSANVAFLRPRHAGLNDLTRLIDDAPPVPIPAAAAVPVPARLAAARPAAPKPAAPPVSTVGGAAGVEFSLVNQDRAASGVAALRFSGALARVAQYRAQDMLNRGYFSHYDPATGQLAFSALMHLWGIPYTTAGENIAWSTNPSLAEINTMFMNSPEHRANILNGAYHQAGIGVASNGGKIMVVEVFSN